MELADFSKPGEKKKLIWAGVLGIVAIIFLWWTFFGFGSGTPAPSTSSRTGSPSQPTPRSARQPAVETPTPDSNSLVHLTVVPMPIVLTGVPEARRNIFAYFEPKPVVKTTPTPPPSTPTPTPPVLLASISPSNVYAKTTEFTLEVAGDRFTPDMKVFVDEREVPSKYKGPQQMSATISATIIANSGLKQIKVRTVDNSAYSNTVGLSVAPPPTPNYTYVGILGDKRYVGDVALLQDKNNKELLSVQRGDLLTGRFRVTSISEKEVIVVDTNLKIRHSLNMTEGERTAGSPMGRPTPRVNADDDEP